MHHPDAKLELTFLGGAGTVTGSRTLLTHAKGRLLVDCGLFQGFKALRSRNWWDPGFDPKDLDGVVLTHAHVDHSGYLPLLVRRGYRGPIHATPATAALCRILWPDAAHLQEEEAARANRRGTTRHKPAKPLFTVDDAERAMTQLEVHRPGKPFAVGKATVTFRSVGHILGAASAYVEVAGRSVLFSGDVGRPDDPIHGPPEPVPEVDLLVLESTYGDRHHPEVDPEAMLGEVVRRTVARGGHVIVPAFAVGRTQRLLFHLFRLRERGEIPNVPIFLNSPLASKATDVFAQFPAAHALSATASQAVCSLPEVVQTVEESKALNRRSKPCVMIAGSGMATGGRVIHHLMAYAPQPQHTVLFTGFQAGGTRGARMLDGEDTVRIFGQDIPIRCEVTTLDNLSAHADQQELVAWVGTAPRPPGHIVLNHGRAEAADTLRQVLEATYGIDVSTPIMGDVVPVF